MSGRDLMTSVIGLYEVTKEPYLRNRINQVRMFAQKLQANGVSVLLPPGGHAVYLDMDDFFHGCDRSPGDFPALGFTLELLKDYGIRAAEAGPFGWEWDKKPPELQAKIPNLVRFAVPRHVLSDQHINYTAAAIKALHNFRHTIPNVQISRGKDSRLRHFSAGLKPVPIIPSSTVTYLGEAKRQISHLARALKQDNTKHQLLLSALDISTEGWGDALIPKTLDSSRWVSHVANDHSPFEYSVQLDQKTGEAELRFLIEAQLPKGEAQGDLKRLQSEALALTDRIASKYCTRVSLDRFNTIRDLFMTEKPDGFFAAWHSYASSKDGPEWKIYLNPSCSSPDRESAISVTRQAFERIGLAESWAAVESVMKPIESVIYFSLDLSSDIDHARAKVYVSHGSTATAATVAAAHAAICPHANTYEIQRFCEVMGNGSLGPYSGKKPLLSCFAFTSKEPSRPVGTVHFPISAYAANDAEMQNRVEKYMAAVSVSPVYKERYNKMLSSVQRRPLAEQGTGIHAWVSLKQGAGGKQSNAFYISPGLFARQT
ncbi:pyridoxal phosphate-dependent transferase [Xylariaceae sp. FL0255]|nr:pyridoxal phosphate-dependent transferase [Xylariaceae sp. FL0255]